MLTPAIILNSSPARRSVPAVGAPKLSFPGLAFACAMSCGIVSTGSDGATETTFGTRVMPPTGAMSWRKLKLSLSKSAGLIAYRRRLRPQLFSVCLTMKPVGEPDAGDRHVRFDERGWETERCRMAQVTAPILDSALADI